jgi:hypothetical protein
MHLMLLQDVKPVEKKIRVSGVGGMQLILNQEEFWTFFLGLCQQEN